MASDMLENRIFINPLTDFGFKRIFTDKELLKNFLTDLLQAPINDIEYVNPEVPGALPTERKAVFDLYCYTDNHEYFIVEMQVGRQVNFADRALFYSSCAIRNQAPRGAHWDYKLRKVYFIGILNFMIFTEKEAKERITERVELWRMEAQKQFSDILTMVFVELPKFTKTREQLVSNTDKWLYLLRNLWDMSNMPTDIANNKIFKHLFEVASIKNLNTDEMEDFKQSILDYYEVQNVALASKMEGLQEGRQEGLQEGRQEGIYFVARNLLANGKNSIEVANVTNLSIEKINQLLSELKS